MPGASHTACAIATNDAVGVAHVALILLLHLADHTAKKVPLLAELIFFGLDVGQDDLKSCFLSLEGSFV